MGLQRFSSLSRPFSLLLLSFFFTITFLAVSQPRSQLGWSLLSGAQRIGLHFVVPTTTTNGDVCKVLLSGAVLGYPEPVLVGWDGRGRFNGTESRLFRLSESLDYLTSLRKSQDGDLVLIVDASNTWLQLPPQAIIQRYQRAINKANTRLKAQSLLERHSAEGIRVRNTVLFGADKFCWPQNGETIPCWSAPASQLPDTIFGPNTDREDVTLRPRYLNSGTIIGPVKDVRDILRASLDKVDVEWDEDFGHNDSDQHYLHVLWGEQEEARLGIHNGTWIVDKDDERTEFHMAVDQESDVYQGHNWYSQYVTWMSYNHSTTSPKQRQKTRQHNPGRLDRLTLSDDLASMPGPYSAAETGDLLPSNLGWQDVMLGTNTATGEVFPLYHVTGNEMAIEQWWPRMWFHEHAEALLESMRQRWHSNIDAAGQRIVAKTGGTTYVALPGHKEDVFNKMRSRDKQNRRGGVWNDLGEYMRWDEICGAYENVVFRQNQAV